LLQALQAGKVQSGEGEVLQAEAVLCSGSGLLRAGTGSRLRWLCCCSGLRKRLPDPDGFLLPASSPSMLFCFLQHRLLHGLQHRLLHGLQHRLLHGLQHWLQRGPGRSSSGTSC
jgi:hypothetical protein